MAQKVFLRSFSGSGLIGTLLPTPTPRPSIGVGTGDASIAANTTQGATMQFAVLNTVAGPADILIHEFVSDPLSAGFTISGTVTFNLWMFESSMNANAGAKCNVYQMKGSDGTLTQIVSSAKGVELGFSGAATVQNWTAAPTSTAMSKGDRLFIQVRFTDVGTMAAGFSVTFDHDGATGVDGDSYVQFNENLTFSTAAAAGTVLYLTNAASDISTADDDRASDFSRGSGSTTAAVTVGAGPISPTQLQRSGTNVRWYSPQIAATTLQGPIALNIRAYDTTAGNFANFAVKVFTRTAGGAETDRAYGLIDWGGNAPTTDSNANFSIEFILGCADVSLSDGDRIGVVVYADDSAVNNIAASTPTISYSGTSGGAAGDTWLQFTSTFSQFTPSAGNVPYTNPMPQLLAQ
jgi:hypothetical protein